MNLKPQCKPAWHELFNKKIVAIFISLALVLLINQLVFSYVLKDREIAKAFTSTLGAQIFNPLPGGDVRAGTNNKLVADFWFPDGYSDNVACNYNVAGNPCLTLVDADGTFDPGGGSGVGTDDDGATTFFGFVPPNTPLVNMFIKPSDNICTNSLTAPACVYNNSGSSSCNDGSVKHYLVDPSGVGCSAPGDFQVFSVNPAWIHSELVNADGNYNWGGDAVTSESLWIIFSQADTELVTGSNWNQPYPNQWQNDVPGVWDIGGDDTFIDPGSTNLFTGAEQVFKDKDRDSIYTDGPDILMDADGAASIVTPGISPNIDDDALADAAPLVPIGYSENVCLNTFGLGGVGNVIIYIDGDSAGTGDCTPGGGTDILIRDDTGTGLAGIIAGFGTFPYTFLPSNNFLWHSDPNSNNLWDYCDPAATPGCDATQTESIWIFGTGINTYNSNISYPVEADGTGSVVAVGTPPNTDDDGLLNGSGVTYLQLNDNVCISFAPGTFSLEDMYVDQTGDCIPSNDPACSGGMPCAHPNLLQDQSADGLNTGSIMGGTWASAAGTFFFVDTLPPSSTGAWTWGANAVATETLFINVGLIVNYSYSASADTDIFSWGVPLYGGDHLSRLNGALGPNSKSIIYADSDGNGLSAGDTILEDDGNVFNGPIPIWSAGNNVIDRQYTYVDYLTIANAGTATGVDIPRLYLWQDNLLGNGICDLGVGPGADDTLVSVMNWNPATNTWDFTDGSLLGTLTANRFCISADFNPGATPGRTFIPQLPQLQDANSSGLHDAGDKGWFFYSQNDGPTGGNVTLGYTFTITPAPSYGGGNIITDTNPPGLVTNITITADANGNVNLSWLDPSDTDLKDIVIDEKHNGQVLSDFVDKGVQTRLLTGRIVGDTYQYRLRAEDNSGNLGSGQYYNITIPASGQAQAEITVPTTPVPAPEQPSLILHDPEPAPPLPPAVQVGELVKSAKAGTIYFIDQDNRRHTFPNSVTYFSYYSDFSNLHTLADTTLAAIPLGSNVIMRPGTYLVKIQSDFKVYAVEPYGVLRWISSETVAADLYGADWSTRIVDVEPTFFTDYQLGADVMANFHPTGSAFSYQNDSKVYYVEQASKRFISSAVFINNKFQNKFVIRNISTDIVYANGADWPKLNMEEIMTLK